MYQILYEENVYYLILLTFHHRITAPELVEGQKNGLAAASPNNLLTITHFSNCLNQKKQTEFSNN